MKLKISSVFLFVAVVSLSAFTNRYKPEVYTVDASKSTVTWKGGKITGSSHNGTISIKSGSLSIDGKNLKGGSFVVDMNSIKDADGSAKLEGHLKADDFFGSAKYPNAEFKITKVAGSGAKVTVTGDLTIKGITKSLSFVASVDVSADGTVTATADKIVVDRTKYDIRYGSKSFFDTLGDKAINDEFELSVKLTAKK